MASLCYKSLATPSPYPHPLPAVPQLTEIWDMLSIANYYKPPTSDLNLKWQPLSYLDLLQLGSWAYIFQISVQILITSYKLI